MDRPAAQHVILGHLVLLQEQLRPVRMVGIVVPMIDYMVTQTKNQGNASLTQISNARCVSLLFYL